MRDNRVKVTAKTLNQMKKLYDAGTKQKLIANAFGVSVSTVQSAKRCNFDYTAYREFVDGQFKQWKLGITKADKLISTNTKAVSDARMDWIVEKLANIEIRLRALELNSK